jgi:hypothetical protein
MRPARASARCAWMRTSVRKASAVWLACHGGVGISNGRGTAARSCNGPPFSVSAIRTSRGCRHSRCGRRYGSR